MFWIHRLPPALRRQFFINATFFCAVIVLIANFWRLSPNNQILAIVLLIGLSFVYLSIWPVVKLFRAKPRPGRGAFVFMGTYVAAFVYGFSGLPYGLLVLAVGTIVMFASFVKYRSILFGGFGERRRAIRAAKLAGKDDLRRLISGR